MKYLLLCFLLASCTVVPRTSVDHPHPKYPHTHFSEAQVESAMFKFWSPILQRQRKCVGSLGITQRFVSPERDRSYYGDRCEVMPDIAVVRCSNSVDTNHHINSKVIMWACSMYLMDDYPFIQVVSEVEVADLLKGLKDGRYGL